MGNSCTRSQPTPVRDFFLTSTISENNELVSIPESPSSVEVTLATPEMKETFGVSDPLLVVKFAHRGSEWTVHKTLKDFFKLHLRLYVKVMKEHDSDRPEVDWYHFLVKHRKSIDEDECPQFQAYLEWLLAHPRTRSADAFCEFSEVSALSFSDKSRKGLKEGYAKKRRGGRRFIMRGFSGAVESISNFFKARFSERWFILKDDHLMYIESRTNPVVKDVLLFDHQFCAELVSPREGGRGTLTVFRSDSIKDTHFVKIQNGYRKIILSFDSHLRACEWLHAVREAHAKSEWNRFHRYRSFAPARDNCYVRMLIDGEAYMQQLLEHLSSARTEVYISGWWLVPDLPLRRPGIQDTIIEVLKNRAQNGVKIFIILYKELSVALKLDSWYSKQTLEAASPNIRVILHPRQLGVRAVLAWSHHQKLVLIDHEVAFVGGLDLCLGRYDNNSHRLFDAARPFNFPGKDYCNPCLRDLTDVRYPMQNDLSITQGIDAVNRQQEPRLPWHDVHCMLRGEVVSDLVRHFVQFWNHVKTDKHRGEDTLEFLQAETPGKDRGDEESGVRKQINKLKRNLEKWKNRRKLNENSPKTFSLQHELKLKRSERIDDLEDISSDSSSDASDTIQIDQLREDAFDHDITGATSMMFGRSSSSAGEKPLSHMTSHRAKTGNRRQKSNLSLDEFVYPSAASSQVILDPLDAGGSTFACNVQLLRSASWWSIGLPTDNSILTAYCELIAGSKSFIYIENQFFVTTAPILASDELSPNILGESIGSGAIRNLIGRAIAKRIVAAVHAKNTGFKIYMVLPVMPAFENAKLMDPSGFVTRVTLQLQFQSLIRGQDSVLGYLTAALGDKKQAQDAFDSHICISGLRQVDMWPDGRVMTEQLYIHSKAIMVDDEKAIIGSANINDRSMLGERDSEIAVLIEDRRFAQRLRMSLWQEHFGLLHTPRRLGIASDDPQTRIRTSTILEDPRSEECFQLWKHTGRSNGDILRDVFGVVPCNMIKTRKDFEKRMSDNSTRPPVMMEAVAEQLRNLSGRVVEFQLRFLEAEDNLYDPMPTTASICPREIFS